MKQITPLYTLMVVLSCAAVLAILDTLVSQKEILLWEGYTFRIPSISDALEEEKGADISDILALEENEFTEALVQTDSTINKILTDTAGIAEHGEIKDSTLRVLQALEYRGNGTPDALRPFFEILKGGVHNERAIRVLHYGDSQIEGDRITGYFRQRLQQHFGGSGPGFITMVPLAQSADIQQAWSSNWSRYSCFTGVDKRVSHSYYGPGACFTRFSKYPAAGDSLVVREAWYSVKRRYDGRAQKIKLYYGNALRKTFVSLQSAGQELFADSLEAGGRFHIRQFDIPSGVKDLTFTFRGEDSPDFYGMSLEGSGGLLVDNFGLRGSSGTFFHRIQRGQLKSFYDHLQVRLILLQYGGNALPYIKSRAQVDQYGSYLSSQIRILKETAPLASIIVLGPSDMSVKNGTSFSTHPFLEDLRDAIKKAAFDNNCAFFDVYEGMGGRNSMISWVNAGIASSDYIHFLPGGARKVATMFYSAFIHDYNKYVSTAVQ